VVFGQAARFFGGQVILLLSEVMKKAIATGVKVSGLKLPMVVAIFACAFLASMTSASATPAPAASSSNGTLLDALLGSSAFTDNINVPVTLQQTMVTSVSASQKTGVRVGNTLMDYTRDVFFSILGIVIVANITFMGFRIMLRASVVESLTQFTVSSFILAVVAGLTATQTPATIIEKAMYQLTIAGRYIGADIISRGMYKAGTSGGSAGSLGPDQQAVKASMEAGKGGITTTDVPAGGDIVTPASAPLEPAVYWLLWLGVEHQQKITNKSTPLEIKKESTKPVDANKEYKFSTASLMSRFWGDEKWAAQLKEVGAADYNREAGSGEAPSMMDNAAAFMLASSPFRALSMALTIGTIQTGAILQPVMQQIGVFSGAIMAFYVVTALGVATLPLIYFQTFRSLWSTYLTVIAGIALIPCFYYIFSAIGFVFATNTFESLFPIATPGTTSFAMTLNAVFMKTVAVALGNISWVLQAALDTSVIKSIVSVTFGWMLVLGRVTFASGVVSSIVVGGVSFALLGGQVAYKWAQGFGAEGLTDRVGELFSGVQSAVASGLSGMYGNYVNTASQGAGSFLGKLIK